MAAKQEKVAKEVVAVARRKAAAREAVSMIKKAQANGRRRRMTKGAALLLKRAAGWTPPKPHEPARSGWVPPKPHEPARAGWTPPKPHEARGAAWTPPKPHEARGKQTPGAAPAKKPVAPAPARMKSQPPKKAPLLSSYGKAAALEEMLLGALVKAAEKTKTAHREALVGAASEYKAAKARGDRELIKKASAKFASILTFDAMTKEALTGEIGAAIMKLMSRVAPTVGKIGETLGKKGFGARAGAWGTQMGQRADDVASMVAQLKDNPNFLARIFSSTPQMAQDLDLARGLGTGTLAGGGALGLSGLFGGGSKPAPKPAAPKPAEG